MLYWVIVSTRESWHLRPDEHAVKRFCSNDFVLPASESGVVPFTTRCHVSASGRALYPEDFREAFSSLGLIYGFDHFFCE